LRYKNNFQKLLVGESVFLSHKDISKPNALLAHQHFIISLIVLGGFNDKSQIGCFTLNNNQWEERFPLITKRHFLTLTQMPDSSVYAIGGENNGGKLTSIEKFNGAEWTPYSDHLSSVSHHCAVTLDEKTILIIGGTVNSTPYSTETFLFTPKAEGPQLDKGSPLIHGRNFHSCARMKSNDIIVVGGCNHRSELASVEILRRRALKWNQGPELPIAISYASIVADPAGGVILVGGQAGGLVLDKLYRLSGVIGI